MRKFTAEKSVNANWMGKESSIKDNALHRATMKLVEELGLQDVWYELTISLYRPNLYFTDILNGKTSVERFDVVYNEYGAPIKCKVRLRDLLEPSLVEEAKKHQALVNEKKRKAKRVGSRNARFWRRWFRRDFRNMGTCESN